MAEPRKIRITVNGQAREGWAEPRRLLVDFLREELGLTGTHLGCEHRHLRRVHGALVDGASARSCLMLAVQADGAQVTTVKGLMAGDRLSVSAAAGLQGPATPFSAASAHPGS